MPPSTLLLLTAEAQLVFAKNRLRLEGLDDTPEVLLRAEIELILADARIQLEG